MYRILILALAALAVAAGLSCYTLVRHPATDMDLDLSADRTCADCHTDADYYHWTDPYYSSYYGFYDTPWQSYYSHPWWYTGGGHGQRGEGSSAPTGARPPWDRSAGGSTGVTRGTSGSYTPTPAPAPQPAVSGHDSTSTQTPETPRQTESGRKREDKPNRRPWGR